MGLVRFYFFIFFFELGKKKMNVLDSECSSGCESGWTLYLEQSFHSPNKGSGFLGKSSNFCYKVEDKAGIEQVEEIDEDEDEEVEDLSMVSDASSGPAPHYFHHDDQVDYFNNNEDKVPCFCNTNNKEGVKLISKSGGKRSQKIKEGRLKECTGDTYLDDTASSPVLNFSNMVSIYLYISMYYKNRL